MQIPVDLRKTLASSILITGGTAMLPGFIPRLHAELVRAIVTSPPSSPRPPMPPGRPRPPPYCRYAALRPLVPHFAILNNPSPPSDARGNANAGVDCRIIMGSQHLRVNCVLYNNVPFDGRSRAYWCVVSTVRSAKGADFKYFTTRSRIR